MISMTADIDKDRYSDVGRTTRPRGTTREGGETDAIRRLRLRVLPGLLLDRLLLSLAQ
jgi:hypothetical protein